MSIAVSKPSRLAASRSLAIFLAGAATLALFASPRNAPAFEEKEVFTTFMGEGRGRIEVELAAFRDEAAVIVEFWASWSPPSLRQHELLKDAFETRLKTGQKKQGKFTPDIVWVSVSLDRKLADARPHMAPNRPSIVNVCDGQGFEGPWPRAFDVKFAPALYIISKEGVVSLANNDAMDMPNAAKDALDFALRKQDLPPGAIATDPFADQRPDTAAVGELAPEFEVKPVNQPNIRRLRLSDLNNKVVLIVTFASWHTGSVEYIDKVYNELVLPYRPHGFVLLAVSIEQDSDRIERELVKKKGYLEQFPIVCQPPADPESMTHLAYPKDDMPRCYLIGKNSVIRDIGEKLEIDRIKQVIVEDLNVSF